MDDHKLKLNSVMAAVMTKSSSNTSQDEFTANSDTPYLNPSDQVEDQYIHDSRSAVAQRLILNLCMQKDHQSVQRMILDETIYNLDWERPELSDSTLKLVTGKNKIVIWACLELVTDSKPLAFQWLFKTFLDEKYRPLLFQIFLMVESKPAVGISARCFRLTSLNLNTLAAMSNGVEMAKILAMTASLNSDDIRELFVRSQRVNNKRICSWLYSNHYVHLKRDKSIS